MEHIEWLNPNKVVIIRTSTKLDTFLDDIKNKKCQQLRLVRIGDNYHIRYKLSGKVYWYKVLLHKKDINYYLTPELITCKETKNKLNRKYLRFNRDWAIGELLK